MRSTRRLVPPDGAEPDQDLQRALGVGHLGAAGNEGVDALARQTHHPAKSDLLAMLIEVRSQEAAQFVPERRILARPQGRAAFDPPRLDAESPRRMLRQLARHGKNLLGQLNVAPDPGRNRRHDGIIVRAGHDTY